MMGGSLLKVLIVDDEKIIRQGMLRSVPWARFGFDAPLEARNGVDALQVYQRERPDLLLTDIRMPLMDGIALTDAIRQQDPDIKIIYLTGHQDIQYIKAAFQNDAVDYILKPIRLEELLQAIEKAARLHTESLGLRRLRVQMEQKLLQSAPIYTHKLLAALTEGRFNDPKEIAERLRFWGIKLDMRASYRVLIVSVEESASVAAGDWEILSFGVQNILQELLETNEQGTTGYAFQLREGNKFVGIVPDEAENPAALAPLIARIQDGLGVFLAQPPSIAVGSPCDGLLNLYESYQSAVSLLIRRFYDEDVSACGPQEKQSEGMPSFSLDKRVLARLCEQLRTHDEQNFDQTAKALLSEIRQSRYMSKEDLRGILLFVLGNLIAGASEDAVSRESIDLLTNCADKLFLCETIDQVHLFMAEILRGIKHTLLSTHPDPGAQLAADIKAILDEHIDKSITIADLSKRVFLTPQYICTLFKQHTRMTIYEYITQQRVERAKALLRARRYKLYEIAPMVGYQDAKAFSKVFKRMTGVTPSEYAEG